MRLLKLDINHKNKLTSILRQCEKEYYSNLLEESKQNIKETWKIINKLLNKKSTKNSSYPSEIKNNGSTISGNKNIAEHFNQFFVNIGPTLAKSIPKCNSNYKFS